MALFDLLAHYSIFLPEFVKFRFTGGFAVFYKFFPIILPELLFTRKKPVWQHFLHFIQIGPCSGAKNPFKKTFLFLCRSFIFLYALHSALLRSSTVKKLELSVTYMVSSVLTWRMQDFSQNSQIW